MNYPHDRPDTVEVNRTMLPTDGCVLCPVTGRSTPDCTPTPSSGTGTLRVVEACCRPIESGEAQPLAAP
jgi:hypothetical protein